VPPAPIMLPLPRSLHAPTSSPFVGRDAELERLRERWRQVCGETRAAVVIGGEAGIGKTRLASALARAVHEQGGLVLYGRCDEGLAQGTTAEARRGAATPPPALPRSA